MTWFMKAMAWLLLGVVLLALAAIWVWYWGINMGWPVVLVVLAGYSLYRSYKAFVEVWRSRLSERDRPIGAPASRVMPST
jgi:hypothetical protein